MFDDPLQPGSTPQSGPLPGSPLPPLVSGDVPMPMSMPQAMASPISPERTPGLPPIPMNLPPMSGGGTNWKKIVIFALAIIVLIGGGVLAAMLLFPATNQNDNANDNTNLTNTVINANTNSNANTNLNRYTNTSNINRTFNSNTNTNLNRNTNGASNSNTNFSSNSNYTVNTNTTSNLNVVTNGNSNANLNNCLGNNNANCILNTNANTNGSSNSNTAFNSNTNTNLTLDTDKDGLADYLEDWLHTNKNKADSDGDTFQDGTEITNGYSPLGKGKLTVPGLKAFCSTSPLVTQYGFSTTDSTNFCSIGGDILASIQVMVASPTITQDLDTQLAMSCKTFTAIDQQSCASITKSIIVDYETSDSAT